MGRVEVAKGLPFLKGRTLKIGEEGKRAFSKSLDLRVSKAEMGENRDSGLGVVDLRGLPAKAWVLRLMDMVEWRWDRVFVVRVLRGIFLQRERRGEVDEEERRKSMSPCCRFH